MLQQLIADSGSTKCEWFWINAEGKHKTAITTGISPYFLTAAQIDALLQKELMAKLKSFRPAAVHFYGTGMKDIDNRKMLKRIFQSIFTKAAVKAETDLLGAARALCGTEKGIACILGTGCNSCYYDGKKIISNSPGLGFILGDEGSGAYLGKKLVQYYLYKWLDKDLEKAFAAEYKTSAAEILDHVYRKETPNKYLASFTRFLSAHRGRPVIEKIIYEGLNDFFDTHIKSYKQSAYLPVHFTGGIAYVFRDVIKKLCKEYGLQAGSVIEKPMNGLVKFHLKQSSSE